MPEWWPDWAGPQFFEEWGPSALRILLITLVGLPLLFWLGRMLLRSFQKRQQDQLGMIVQKAVTYTGCLIALVMILHELGFDPKGLLGAAGILGVALGFASQTSISNIISGAFLISEHAFRVGDFISVEGTNGVVVSVDLLSVKLRTLDNRLVRIPNETLIKTQMINITRFPIRRLDFQIGVAYKEDVDRVVAVLKEVAGRNPLALDEPEPLIQMWDFGESQISIFFGVWFAKQDYLAVRGSILRDVKARFDEEGIEIPFPHRTLYAGSATDPFPVRVVNEMNPAPPPAPTDAPDPS